MNESMSWVRITPPVFAVLAASAGVLAPAARADGFMRSVGTAGSLPRITIAGRGIATYDIFNGSRAGGGQTNTSQVDYSDSALLTELDTKLYSGTRGGFLLGLRFPDRNTNLGTVFYHEVNTFLQGQRWGLRVGRTRLPNTLVMFPTLRDDDQLPYTDVPNGLSNSTASEYTQYGNVIQGSYYWMHSLLKMTVYGANEFETDAAGNVVNRFKLNSGGVLVQYKLPPAIRYQRRLEQLGGGFYFQDVNVPGHSGKMLSALAGTVVNLNRNPLRHWDVRFQGLYNAGAGVDSVATVQDQALARSAAVVGSLRYLRAPYQVPRFQAAITVAYQKYLDVGASRFSIIPNVTYRLGNGFDVVAQYAYDQNNGALRYATNGRSAGLAHQNIVWLGMVYSFNFTFNNYFGNRNDILNMEHQYIP